MTRFFVEKEELATLKQLLASQAIQYSDQQFDMNDNFVGFKLFNGLTPKNAPDGTSKWGVAASFPLDKIFLGSNTIQFIFDLNGLFMFRTYDGSSGVVKWNAWKQVGGNKA